MTTSRTAPLLSALSALLAVGWYGVLAVIVALTCMIGLSFTGVINGPNTTIAIPAQVRLDSRDYHVTAPSLGIEEVRLGDVEGQMLLTYHPPSGLYAATTAAAVTLPLVLMLFVLGQLRAIFRTLKNGTPFVRQNATRLRRVAWLVLSATLAQTLLGYVGNRHVMAHFSADGLRFEARPDVNVLPLLVGLILFVIAEVFRLGTRLDEEQSLTV